MTVLALVAVVVIAAVGTSVEVAVWLGSRVAVGGAGVLVGAGVSVELGVAGNNPGVLLAHPLARIRQMIKPATQIAREIKLGVNPCFILFLSTSAHWDLP
jgi:hypothetical protein